MKKRFSLKTTRTPRKEGNLIIGLRIERRPIQPIIRTRVVCRPEEDRNALYRAFLKGYDN